MKAFLSAVGSPLRRPSATTTTTASSSLLNAGPPSSSRPPEPGDVAALWETIKRALSTWRAGSATSSSVATSALNSYSLALNSLVDGLVREATLSSSETTGPCLEYVLISNILAQLVDLCLPDEPSGSLPLLLKAFDSLVTRLGDDFIALAHRPLLLLIRGCSGSSGVSPVFTPYASTSPSSASSSSSSGDESPRLLAQDSSLPRTAKPPAARKRRKAEPLKTTRPPPPALGDERVTRYPGQLAALLCAMCARMKQHPDLLPIYFHDRRALLRERKRNQRKKPGVAALLSGSKSALLSSPSVTKPTVSAKRLSPCSSGASTDDEFASATSVGTPQVSSQAQQQEDSNGVDVSKPYEEDDAKYDFPIFSVLLSLMHADGRTGDFARQGLLFLVDLAMASQQRPPRSHAKQLGTAHAKKKRMSTIRTMTTDFAALQDIDTVASALSKYIALSPFAEVLGAGVGAAFGLLPRKLFLTPPAAMSGTAPHGSPTGNRVGSTKDDDDENEQSVLRSMGIAMLHDPETRKLLDLWLSMLEFVQDILQRASKKSASAPTLIDSAAEIHGLHEVHSPDLSEASGFSFTGHHVLATLTAEQQLEHRILAAFKTAFLENALLPSLQEAQSAASPLSPVSLVNSDEESSAGYVAVMTYIERMLNVVEPASVLGRSIAAFLLGRAGADLIWTNSLQGDKHTGLTSPPLPSPSVSCSGTENDRSRDESVTSKPKAKRKTVNLGLALDVGNGSGSRAADRASGTAPIRMAALEEEKSFDLKMLVLQQLRPTLPLPGAAQAIATISDRMLLSVLSLLHTLLQRYDHATLDMLDAVPDLHVTRFPFVVPLYDESFIDPRSRRNDGKGDTGEEELFVYLDSEDGEASEGSFVYPDNLAAVKIATSTSYSVIEKHQPASDAGGSEVQILFRLLGVLWSDQTGKHHDGGASGTLFSQYLRDAESAIQRDAAFQRGCALLEASRLPVGSQNGFGRSKVEPRGACEGSQRSSDHVDPMLLHGLSASSPIVASIIYRLTHFFSNTAAINLSLSGCIAKLISCPYRGLTGWLLPPGDHQLGALQEMGLITYVLPATDTGTSASNAQPPRKAHVRHASSGMLSLFTPRKLPVEPAAGTAPLPMQKRFKPMGTAPILDVICELLNHVDVYAHQIKDFDRHLTERRSGLSFVDDLAEALGSERSPTRPSLADRTQPRNQSGINTALFVQADPAYAQNQTQSQSHSQSPLTTPTKSRFGSMRSNKSVDLSPFAGHYERTAGIRVRAYHADLPAACVPSEAASEQLPAAYMHEQFDDGSVGHGILEASTDTSRNAAEDHKSGGTVSLSTLLDNVIILEEIVKEFVALVAVRKSLGIDAVLPA